MGRNREITKILNKIDTISRKGKTAVYQYYNYISELIDNQQYYLFQDVLMKYYDIDIRLYKSVEEMRRLTFPKIREKTQQSFQKQLKKLFDSKNVYPIGFHFFDKTNSHYLGDIMEVEEPHPTIFYQDPELVQKLPASENGEIKIINLEVTKGLSSSVYDAIPEFRIDPKSTLQIGSSSEVTYGNQIYECVQSYTWDTNNQITPTYSEYWTPKSFPTYSMSVISDDTVPLYNKYSIAIDLLKS